MRVQVPSSSRTARPSPPFAATTRNPSGVGRTATPAGPEPLARRLVARRELGQAARRGSPSPSRQVRPPSSLRSTPTPVGGGPEALGRSAPARTPPSRSASAARANTVGRAPRPRPSTVRPTVQREPSSVRYQVPPGRVADDDGAVDDRDVPARPSGGAGARGGRGQHDERQHEHPPQVTAVVAARRRSPTSPGPRSPARASAGSVRRSVGSASTVLGPARAVRTSDAAVAPCRCRLHDHEHGPDDGEARSRAGPGSQRAVPAATVAAASERHGHQRWDDDQPGDVGELARPPGAQSCLEDVVVDDEQHQRDAGERVGQPGERCGHSAGAAGHGSLRIVDDLCIGAGGAILTSRPGQRGGVVRDPCATWTSAHHETERLRAGEACHTDVTSFAPDRNPPRRL